MDDGNPAKMQKKLDIYLYRSIPFHFVLSSNDLHFPFDRSMPSNHKAIDWALTTRPQLITMFN